MSGWLGIHTTFQYRPSERNSQTSQRPPIIHFYAERGIPAVFNLIIMLDERIIALDVLNHSFDLL